MSDKSDLDSAKNSAPMVPGGNGGMLLAGGKPGNKGNVHAVGRPRSRVRDACLIAYEERISVLADIADDTEEKAADRIRALGLLGHLGLSENKVEKEFVMELAHEMAQVIRPLPNGKELLDRIKKAWMPIVAKRL